MASLPDVNAMAAYFEMGGLVMAPLAMVAVALWYGLVSRLMIVRPSKDDPRRLIDKMEQGAGTPGGVTAGAARLAIDVARSAQSAEELNSLLREKFGEIKSDIGRFRALVRGLVIIAPLLGLLGTVDGMIETFKALGEMALFTQSGGIAGGISRALFTKQIGLAISIPGILVGRIIVRKERHINRELDQIKDLVCARKHELLKMPG